MKIRKFRKIVNKLIIVVEVEAQEEEQEAAIYRPTRSSTGVIRLKGLSILVS